MGSKDKDFVTREEFEDWGLRVDRLDAGINEIVRDFVEELSQHIEALESEVGVLQAIIFGPMNAVPTNVRGVGGVGLAGRIKALEVLFETVIRLRKDVGHDT